VEQRTEEWFAARTGKITASSVGAILGIDPNRNREDVMRDMVREYHGVPREFQGNIATQWGVIHEVEAREEFQYGMGVEVIPTGLWVHPVETWLGASPDGLVGDDALIEIKCPFGIRLLAEPAFKSATDQPHYMAQMQIQMFVTGRKSCHFYQWTPHGHLWQNVEYDQSAIDDILPKLREFYDRYLHEVQANPEIYLEPKRKVIDTPRAIQLVAEYYDLVEAIENAEVRKAEVLDDIVKMSGGVNASIGGHNLSKIERIGSISYSKALKVLAPGANLEPWRGKPSSHWVLK